MVWVEIDNTSIFGHYPHYSCMPSANKVKSNDPRLRARYNQRVLEAFENEEIQLQVEALSLIMVRFRAGEDVSSLVAELDSYYSTGHQAFSQRQRANMQESTLLLQFVSLGSS